MSFDAEEGRYGRAVFARLRPDEDLINGIEALCREANFNNAVIRGGLGSINEAHLDIGGGRIVNVPYLGLEITALYGEVRNGVAKLAGSVVNGEGQVFSGRFVPGQNPISVTAEVTLEEWLVQKS